MDLVHPACTDLEAWQPDDETSLVGLHVGGCPRCRHLADLLHTERRAIASSVSSFRVLEELSSDGATAPKETLRLRFAAARCSDKARTLAPQSKISDHARQALSKAIDALDCDAATGLVWITLNYDAGRMCLGDLVELRAYLEGAWFEQADGESLDLEGAELDRAVERDVQWAIGQLQPRLQAIGWYAVEVRAPKADATHWLRLAALRLRDGVRNARERASWSTLKYASALALAPVALLVLIISRPATNDDGQIASVSRYKGSPGLPELEVIIQREEHQLVYDTVATIHPGDRMRVRVRSTNRGRLAAGILTDAGEWFPFFERDFGAGEHTPREALRVGTEPSPGTLLVGSPEAVQNAKRGRGRAGVLKLRLIWRPRPSERGNTDSSVDERNIQGR